jgi:LacI family transcriptional regulator
MTIIAATANDAARQRLALAGMMERQVDGLILATATLRDPAVEAWVEGRAPLVLIHRTDQTGQAPAVLSDEIKGIGLAVEHLASLGHRRLGHVGGPQHLSTGALRLCGFRDAIGKLGLADEQAIVFADTFSRGAGRTACRALMERHPDVTALVVANDLLALGCYDALAERGLRCPDDVSVTGHNDAPFVDMVAPPLTTVRVAQREMGVEAARLLLRLMRDESVVPADILLPPSLVVRGSTARTNPGAAPQGDRRP